MGRFGGFIAGGMQILFGEGNYEDINSLRGYYGGYGNSMGRDKSWLGAQQKYGDLIEGV